VRRPPRRRAATSHTLEAAAVHAAALTADSREVSTSFGQVASAMGEMRSSIGEISANTSRASQVASDAVEHARVVTERVAALQQVTDSIGEIVQVITSITQQSRMLALNATIEAARAGEVGRGFAVVANEVKALAEKTEQSASRIAQQVAEVQAETAAASDGIAQITATIGLIHEAQNSIAAAVEEQSTATGSIAANVDRVSAGSDRIAASVAELAQAQRLSFVQASLTTASDLLQASGVTLGEETVSWTAVNQVTKQSRRVELPQVLLDRRWIGQVDQPAVPSAFVDEVHRLVGGTVTLFQRMTAEGDMIRVATNVVTPEGRRNIGTYIPVVDGGKRTPVLAKVLGGETFTGDALVVGKEYTTGYEPVFADSGEVIGMLYVGLPK
jgi:methyl-accepting chemotaxis protein